MKKEHKEKIEQRLQKALKNLYHNATSAYIRIDNANLCAEFDRWFYDVANDEIAYIQEGLGMTAEEYKKQRKLGFTHNERYYWLVSRIVEFGKLYTYGRGGRTLAPDRLVSSGVCWNIKKDYFDDCSIEAKIDAIEILEAFNLYVANWNTKENLLQMWKSYAEMLVCEKISEAKTLSKKFAEIANDLRLTQINKKGAICTILSEKLRAIYKAHKETIKELILWKNETLRSA